MLRRLVLSALFLAPTAALAGPVGGIPVVATVPVAAGAPAISHQAPVKLIRLPHGLMFPNRLNRYGNTGQDGEITF